MAAKDAALAPAPAGEAPRKGKKLLIIVVALSVTLALIVAVVLALLLTVKGGDDAGEDDEDAQEVVQKGNTDAPPIFIALDPFTVNLAHTPDDGDRYMQLTIFLEVESLAADTTVKARMPRIRNDVTLIMSGKTAAELMTREGKEALAQEIQGEINRIINPPRKGKASGGPVTSVLFTSFIIQ
ncbi:MAG: flagellar basal body-associated FliL family protein [Zoogloeaceae bacterium]|jgi:flagellar FliL protein|nr:flagellar basal body-associated FliL family protein [Zoogloeaceae bacterium]